MTGLFLFSIGRKMGIDEIVNVVRGGNRGPYLFHFTDSRNYPSIQAHGILSRKALIDRKFNGFTPGGNLWSLEQDIRKNLHDYVHLCFFDSHPMEFLARRDGRINRSIFLRISSEVLRRPGVKICPGVSNARDAKVFDLSEIENVLDMEVLFQRTNWKDEAVRERLNLAKKYEVLVPKYVAIDQIVF